jgi:hypothetical protein
MGEIVVFVISRFDAELKRKERIIQSQLLCSVSFYTATLSDIIIIVVERTFV